MTFSRAQLLEIITPHVLRTLVRLRGSQGELVTETDLAAAGLSEEERGALVQTKRLIAQDEPGSYRIFL